MYKFMKAWTKKKCFTSFNSSNGEKVSSEEVHGFHTNGRKVQLRNQKRDELDTKIDRGCQCIELRKEIILMMESMRNETDLKLCNINESLNEISRKINKITLR